MKLRAAIATLLSLLAAGPMSVQANEGEPATPHPVESDSGTRAITGIVLSAVNVTGHTYVQVQTDDEILWAAVPGIGIREGDRVFLPSGFPMPEFYSPSLDRRFDLIYFAPSAEIRGREGEAPSELK